MTEALERARTAVRERRWQEASDAFAAAARNDGGLAAPDLELRATTMFLRGHVDSATTDLIAAHEAYLAGDDITGAARTAGWLSIQMLEAGDPALSAPWIARGLRLADRLADAEAVGGLVALMPAAFSALFVGDIVDATRRFEEIAAIAARTGDSELAAQAAFARGKGLSTIGSTAEGLALIDEALAIVAAGEVSPLTPFMFYRVVLDVAHEGFDLDRAERWTADFDTWCRGQTGLVAYSGQRHAYRAQLFLLHGEWAEASLSATLAEERLRAGDFTSGYVANYQLGELQRHRGEFRAAGEHYRSAGATGWDPQPGLALLRLAERDVTAAQAMIRHSVVAANEAVRRRLLPAAIEIETAAGDVVAARKALISLRESRQVWTTPLLAAVTAFGEAQVLFAEDDAEGALEAVTTAATAWSILDAPYEVARCGILRGRILQRLADDAGAAVAFGAARVVLRELGARAALADLDLASGVREVGALTLREVEVLRLVSTGRTNRGIATALSLSEKTVARHLSNIYLKLGISSRSAATAYAYEHALV
ncbi:LuxR C-terminal-related transcriptional regulator [Microbacterium lacus]|uniref:helix-turn-helix transcriptional regulator n=1 Tax=Microbacterium lacus TaxID=415217 RepID=UPI0038504174